MGVSTLTWVVLAALLVLSGTFSASETALFSLAPHERRRAGGAAERLLVQPRALLVAVLIANLVVNVLYFAFSARVQPIDGPYGPLLSGLVALVVLVLFGEVLPKSLALRARVPAARLGAVPLGVLMVLLTPVQRGVDRLLETIYRVLGDAARAERGITTEALGQVLERSAEQGLLLESEAGFLAGVVELAEVRVREVMTPRVDMLLLDVRDERRAEVVARAVEARVNWIVVVDGNPDRVLGRVRVRDLLLEPERPLSERVEPIAFVPEVATLLHLLEYLRGQRVAVAVAVDEWGGTAGVVRLEEVFEEIVGDLRVEGERAGRPVVALGEGRFRVMGALSIRDWNELFGHRVVPNEFETVGGWVTALLARLPRHGDEVHAGGLVFTVDQVERRRIRTLEISVAPASDEVRP